MSASIQGGPVTKSLSRDNNGHREYTVSHRVETDDFDDGPQIVMDTPGLPVIGAVWNFGNDSDVWAFAHPEMEITIADERKGDPTKHWEVEQKFSTKPLERDQSTAIENPLTEPFGISGSFNPRQIEATRDRFGNSILHSNKRRVRGASVTFDDGAHTVKIDQNVLLLGLDTFSQMINTVNDSPMWGLGARRIKLSNVTWERKFFKISSRYYTRSFHFDVNFLGFDRIVLDEGDYVLRGKWINGVWTLSNIGGSPPDPTNPAHYIRSIDVEGNEAHMLLDGTGKPLNNVTATEDDFVSQTIEYYQESNFWVLGIPSTF